MSTLELLSHRNLRLVESEPSDDKSRPFLLVHGVRTVFLVTILLISFIYQIRLGNFLNTEMWLPIYTALGFNFLLNAIYLFYFDRLSHQMFWNSTLFLLDTAAITLLIYFTGTGQSLFLFLYLVNLILAGLIFPKEGAWLLTGWTSICFSLLLIFSPEVSGQNLYFSIAINNLAFFAVTFLGGRLAEQLTVAGAKLEEAKSDIATLRNFNELIVNNISAGLMVVSRTGFIQFHNAVATGILGENLFQSKITEVLPQVSWLEWIATFDDKTVHRKDIRINPQDEVERVIEVIAAPFRDESERAKGWLLRLEDRTDLKALEDQLRQKEKLAAVGQLAAGIAHEIRNPLASISGSIQLLTGDSPVEAHEQRKLMNIVSREIDRLNSLITEFLEYVRPEHRANQLVDVNAIIREVAEMIRLNSKLRQDVEQKLELEAQSKVLGDKDKLKQAILNFVVNAYQAMDKTAHPILEVLTKDEGDKVVLVIRDNGCGIKKENLNRIFEPFHTTKPQGSGLGLAITHKILEAHNARIFVESEINAFTRFLIELPSERDVYTRDPLHLKRA
jgi:two-component system sensor histidine kinase PilS (NtrC family)